MRNPPSLFAALLVAAPLTVAAAPRLLAQVSLRTTFTYQAELTENGALANGFYDLKFSLWDAPMGGNQVAPDQFFEAVPIMNGRFTQPLDFGEGVFMGEPRYLEVVVTVGGLPFTLSPRQMITPAPESQFAMYASEAMQSFTIMDGAIGGPPPTLFFGPSNLCSIVALPSQGLIIQDPSGMTVRNPLNMDEGMLMFGMGEAMIGLDSAGPAGLLLSNPGGVRVFQPQPKPRVHELLFGPTDLCSIGIQPSGLTGMIIQDPNGARILNPQIGEGLFGHVLRFGPTDDCALGVLPELGDGMIFTDPAAFNFTQAPVVRLSGPGGAAPNVRLFFGPTDSCSIGLVPDIGSGMVFTDPQGFFFDGGNMGLGVTGADFRLQLPNLDNSLGQGLANAWQTYSSARWKENVRTIDDPIATIERLRGVRFDWNEAHGGCADVGFIAEEVGAVLPELVTWEADSSWARSLETDGIVAVTVEAIKAQQARIETLERERLELETDRVALESRVAFLEAQNRTLAERLARLETLVTTGAPSTGGAR